MSDEEQTNETTHPRRRSRIPSSIWVLGIDDGLEGKRAPHMAFDGPSAQKDAEQGKVLAQGPNAVQRIYITEVPVWRRSRP